MEYAIETFSLTKVFSDLWGRDKVYAVNDLDLQVCYNEVFGLLGPTGSGKKPIREFIFGSAPFPPRTTALPRVG